jgi:D-alanyl-D-alanine carboxypeptidase/D-alanyl-D-alanine-endopeptidase (penicillin-binding protein 4)
MRRHSALVFPFSFCCSTVLRFCGLRLPLALCLLLFASCATSRRFAKNLEKQVANSPVFNRAFTGFTLLDPATGKTLADMNGDKYFTPASNTKILTLATCLEVLGDSVPGMQVIKADEKFIFRGAADPTFLHPFFQNWQTCRDTLLAHWFDSLRYLPRQFPEKRFGPGWAWDDYNEDYQPERSEMPIYGNCLRFTTNGRDSTQVEPDFFKNKFFLKMAGHRAGTQRVEHENFWGIEGFKKVDGQFFPFRMDASMVEMLLSDTLHRDVVDFSYTEHPWHQLYATKTIYSTPLDTVLRRMMHQSDNFIAEQMLLVCAGQKFDILRQDTMIKWMLDSVLTSLPQRPRWSDGSGLSRYNLISPGDLAQVLLKLWKEQPHEFLLSLFPAGGVSGTVSDWYKGKDSKPYVFAKTGGMSGVHCLSGYVVTKHGKTLIFSFMHNNFVGSNKAWEEEMQRILELIREKY